LISPVIYHGCRTPLESSYVLVYEKIELFLQLGSVVGILIDPDKREVAVYRLDQNTVTLKDGDTLTLQELLPGWELAISELWPPEFD
jgi:Uma2 family endonuclease